MLSIARSLAAESITPNILKGSADEFMMESQLILKDYETLTEGMEIDSKEVWNLMYLKVIQPRNFQTSWYAIEKLKYK
jgi:hypothetical protein